jgi:glycogen operon protein
MEENHWGEGYAKSIGIFLNGKALYRTNQWGRPVVDDSFYLIFNAHYEPLKFVMPDINWGRLWKMIMDTATGWVRDEQYTAAGDTLVVKDKSIIILQKME